MNASFSLHETSYTIVSKNIFS